MYIKIFVNIVSKAWVIPILSKLHEGVAGRQAPLLAATGASRTAFAQSMKHLISIDLLERNPGYGHPLRPEFRLTKQGIPLAAIASQISNASEFENQDLLRRSWTLPVLAAVHTSGQFNNLKNRLHPISDRALSQSLKLLEDRHWLLREVDATRRPPKPIYKTINTGAKISWLIANKIGLDLVIPRDDQPTHDSTLAIDA